jgi:hypothetical protein
MGLLNIFRKKAPAQGDVQPSETDAGFDSTVLPPQVEQRVDRGSRALDVMSDKIYRQCVPLGWFVDPFIALDDWDEKSDSVILGVCVRSKYGSVRSCPTQHPGFQTFEEAIMRLNCRVAIKMHCKAVEAIMETRMYVSF